MENKCEDKDCRPKRVCWQGFKMSECPIKRLENEKLFFAILLTISVGIILWKFQ